MFLTLLRSKELQMVASSILLVGKTKALSFATNSKLLFSSEPY